MTTRNKIFALALFSFVSLALLAAPMPAWGQVTVISVPSGGDLQGAINQAAAIINGAAPSDVVIEVAPGPMSPRAWLAFW